MSRNCIVCWRPLEDHPNPACYLTRHEATAETYDLDATELHPDDQDGYDDAAADDPRQDEEEGTG